MKIFDTSGYVNVKGILEEGYPFNFLVGGRGTGKTYTTLKVAKEEGRKFMLMRRTQSQADLISKPEFSVFKPLNEDLGWNVQVRRISKYNSAFYEPLHASLHFGKRQTSRSTISGYIANPPAVSQ